MKAMRLAEFGSPENLRLEEAPEPELREAPRRNPGQSDRD